MFQKTNEKYLIALDLDGTLLTSKKTISFLTKKYLQKLNKRGHVICLASGRPERSIVNYYNILKLDSPIVSFNGSYVHSPKNPAFNVTEFNFPKKDIIDVYNKTKKYTINVICETNTDVWADQDNSITKEDFWTKDITLHFGPIPEILTKCPMTMILALRDDCLDKKDEIVKIVTQKPDMAARFWPWKNVTYCEIFYRDNSKAKGLRTVAKEYNIPEKNFIFIGDGHNDIDMIKAAHHGIAMANACDDLKKEATIVAQYDNNHNGIYHALKKLFKELN